MPHQTKQQNEMPNLTPDRNVDIGVQDSFPASDPAASTASQGARAVPPQQMMDSPGNAQVCMTDCVEVQARFRDKEAAKLALESLVREGPLDRRQAAIMPADDTVTLRFQTTSNDAQRLRELVRKQGGAEL